MSELIFIRHADTDMAGTFCGHSDPELNARGWVRLREIVESLGGIQIDAVYSSDLRRAHSTARAIASAFGVECVVRPALREIYFGQWEGLTWEEIERRDPGYAKRWLDGYPDLSAPDGEMFGDFERRVLDEARALGLGKVLGSLGWVSTLVMAAATVTMIYVTLK